MSTEQTIRRRRPMRLKGFDYTTPGAYFVTICTRRQRNLLGEIAISGMKLSGIGRVVADYWKWLEEQYPYLELDEWFIMPNHLHGIINFHATGRGGSRTAPTKHLDRKPLGRIIGAFKTTSTKKINLLQQTPAKSFWQRGYFDRIIRNDQDLEQIRTYIVNNPLQWELDEYYSK